VKRLRSIVLVTAFTLLGLVGCSTLSPPGWIMGRWEGEQRGVGPAQPPTPVAWVFEKHRVRTFYGFVEPYEFKAVLFISYADSADQARYVVWQYDAFGGTAEFVFERVDDSTIRLLGGDGVLLRRAAK
jgi:hypothetical protein